MKTLKLRNKINIDGKDVKELTYDQELIDGDLFLQAQKEKTKMLSEQAIQMSTMQEFDRTEHLYIGMASIIACNPKIAFSDLEQLKGSDLAKVVGIGRGFYLNQEESQETPTENA